MAPKHVQAQVSNLPLLWKNVADNKGKHGNESRVSYLSESKQFYNLIPASQSTETTCRNESLHPQLGIISSNFRKSRNLNLLLFF